MAMNFPDSPTEGDEFVNDIGRTWVWTGSTWKSKTVDLSEIVADTTNVHGISDTANLAYLIDLESKQDIVDGVSDEEISYLSTVTSNIQDQLDGKAATAHTHTLENITDVTVSSVEVNYLSGITSNVQDQIDSKSSDGHSHLLEDISDVTASSSEVNKLTGLTSSTEQLNYLYTTTSNIQDQLDGKSNSEHTHILEDITDVDATAGELNILSGVLIATQELNYLQNLGSEVQEQIDTKQDVVAGAASTVVYVDLSPSLALQSDSNGKIGVSGVTSSELGYVSGVTSAIQDQLDGKSDASHTHILEDITDITASATEVNLLTGTTVSAAQINYLDTTTSNIQNQIDSKADLGGATFTGDVEAGNVTITGNLYVQGTTTTINATDLSVKDNMIYINQAGASTITDAVGSGTEVVYTTEDPHGYEIGYNVTISGIDPSSFDYNSEGASITAVTSNTFTINSSVTDTYVSGGTARGKVSSNPDLGWAAGRYDTSYAHTGVFRDATDATFKFFDGYIPEPDESVFIDTSHTSFSLAPIAVSGITTEDISASGDVDFSSAASISGIAISTGIDDVSLSSLANNEILVYDGSSWVNKYINAIPSKISNPTPSLGYYYLVPGDAGKIIEINDSSAVNVAIPLSETYEIGTQIVIMNAGTGQVAVVAEDIGTQTLNYSPGNILRDQWSAATILKRSSNTWVLYGDLTA